MNTSLEHMHTDDIPIEPPENGYSDEEPLAPGAYPGRFVSFKVVDTPDWKLEQMRTRNPEKEPDKQQWEWRFEVLATIEMEDGTTDQVTRTLSDYTTRSWHERANAAAYARGLLGLMDLAAARENGLRTRDFIGKGCQVWVTEKNGRNYIDKVLPLPKKARARPAPSTEAPDIPFPAD